MKRKRRFLKKREASCVVLARMRNALLRNPNGLEQ